MGRSAKTYYRGANPLLASFNSEVSIMGNGIGIYKNPWCNQYVCPEGYAFFYNGINQGRIIWTASPEGYYVDKDEKN